MVREWTVKTMKNDDKTGRWIMEYGDFSGYVQCSKCKGFALDTYAHCPLCGAEMDGEVNERP